MTAYMILPSFRSSLLLDLIKFCLEYERVALAEEYIASTIGAAKVSLNI